MDRSNIEDVATRLVDGGPLLEPDPSELDIDSGSALGRYVIRALIGAGGMGRVYRAWDPQLGREVALKVLDPRRIAGDTGAAFELVHEARAMARLAHPHVVPVYDVHTVGEQVFLVMEFVEGSDLTDWLGRAVRSVDEILAVYRAAGRGLVAAHAAGVVHRDFKPANVLVGDDGAVRVTDFGIARTSDTPDSVEPTTGDFAGESLSVLRTEAGVVVGTPAYMSPEQHAARSIDARSDQYSFCVALYEALHGGRPFEGPSLDSLALLKHAGPPRASVPPGVPLRVHHAIQRGLSVDPDDRFATMEALLEQLQPRSRRRAVPLIGVAVMGAVGLALAWVGPSSAGSCEDAKARVAEVWGAPQREAVASAMRATGVPYAEDGVVRIHTVLDEVADRWASAWTQACALPEAPERDHAMSCLTRQRQQLGAMVSALEELDARSAATAISGAWSLPAPGRCLRPQHAGRGPPPPAPELVAEVDAVRDALNRSEALRTVGRQPEALPIARAQLEIAERIGYAPLVAEVELELGKLAMTQRELDMVGLLEPAYFRAIDTGALELAAQAASLLVFEYGTRQVDLERARSWERHATAAVEQADAGPSVRSLLRSSLCGALIQNGRFDEGRAACLDAIDGFEAAHGPDHPSMLAPLANLAKLALDLRRADEAASYAERAHQIARRSYGPTHPWIRNTLGLRGAAAGLAGRHDEALASFQESLALTKTLSPHEVELISSQLQNIATSHVYQGQLDAARDAYLEAIDYVVEHRGEDHHLLGFPHAGLGRLETNRESFVAARGHLERALELLAEHYGDDSIDVLTVRFDLGRIAYTQGRLDDSLARFEPILARDPDRLPQGQHAHAAAFVAKIHVAQQRLERIPDLLARGHRGPATTGSSRSLAEARFEYAQAARRSGRLSLDEAHEQARVARRELAALSTDDPEMRQRIEDAAAAIDRWLASPTDLPP